MKIKSVQCYSGYKAGERPVSFTLDSRTYNVEDLLDQWYGEDYTYFKVRADDGNIYILRYDFTSDEWSLASFRSE